MPCKNGCCCCNKVRSEDTHEFKQGWKAYQHYKKSRDNPYPKGRKHDLWQIGLSRASIDHSQDMQGYYPTPNYD